MTMLKAKNSLKKWQNVVSELQKPKAKNSLKKWQNVVSELQKPKAELLSFRKISDATGASISVIQNIQRILKNI